MFTTDDELHAHQQEFFPDREEESKDNKVRGIATITVYVYGNSEDELLENASKICDNLNKELDCNAEVEEYGTKNFGENYKML